MLGNQAAATEAILFVEGFHDCVLVESMIGKMGRNNQNSKVVSIGGKSAMWANKGDDFSDQVRSAIQSADTGAVGLIVDADEDADRTWRLIKEQFDFPEYGISLDGDRIPVDGYAGSHAIGARFG